MISILLSVIAYVLLKIFGTIALFWTFIKRGVFRKGKLSHYFYDVALSLDQAGNVICQDLFNDIMAHPDGYRFGDEDDTVSEVLGVNLYHFDEVRLYGTGRFLAWLLDKIDDRHTYNAYRHWLREHDI